MLRKIFRLAANYKHRWLLIALFHAALVTAALAASFFIRFDGHVSEKYRQIFVSRLPLVVLAQLVVFGHFRLYSGMWRFVSAFDIWNIAKANTIAIVLAAPLVKLCFGQGFPRSIYFIDWLLCIGLMSAVRISTRLFREGLLLKRKPHRGAKRILIVGAGSAGLVLLGEHRRNPSTGRIVGFIDDDHFKVRQHFQGVRVLGSRRDIPRVVLEQRVDEIILAIPSASGTVVREILEWCEQTPAKIKVVPGLAKILSGEMEVKPRDVQPNDLLGRETVTIESGKVAEYVKGRTVLVTGAGGSIGSEICRQIAAFEPKELILLDHHENLVYFLTVAFKTKFPKMKVRTVIGDVRDVGLIQNLFSRRRPHVVFHAAAHKHVPLMEDSPAAAVKNNIFGTRNLIYACHHYRADRFVLISTDKAVNPVNVMGMSKRAAEMVLQSKAAHGSHTKFMAVRFGNVLGSAGSVVPLFKQQIEEGGPITITHPDVKRYFMSIPEAVMLVLQAGAQGRGGELFILDMGEQIKVVELAKNLVALSGLTLGKDIELKVVGLRPGEKLEEELLLDKEQDAVTRHNKIFVSRDTAGFDRRWLHRNLKKLGQLAHVMDEDAVVKLLKEIVYAGHAPSPTDAPDKQGKTPPILSLQASKKRSRQKELSEETA